MLHRTGIVVTAAALAIGTWAACKSYNEAEVLRGGADQACFENSTCFAGLACVSNRCVPQQPSGEAGASTSSSSSSGSFSSSSSSSSGDAAPTDECAFLSAGKAASCPVAGGPDENCSEQKPNCCPGIGCMAERACSVTTPAWECFAGTQCATGQCCVAGLASKAKLCEKPTLTRLEPSRCGSVGTAVCPNRPLAMCNADAECQVGLCNRFAIELEDPNGAKYVRIVGVCASED